MEEIDKAIEFVKDFKKQNPLLEDQVADYLDLMMENIEEGESPQNELQLFINACNDLLE
jgi:hypothetical protein